VQIGSNLAIPFSWLQDNFVAVDNEVTLIGSMENMANNIHQADEKTVLANDDEIGIDDSEANYGLKKTRWSKIKDALRDFFN